MLENKRIMTILAHPDDETLGCGGTIHRFKNNKIYVAVPVKRIPTLFDSALKHLGVSLFRFGDFDDNELDKYPLMTISKWVESAIESFNPDVVITHNHRCMNQDHRVLYEACSIATRPVKNKIQLLTCEVPSSTGYLRPTAFEPNFYVTLQPEDLQAKVLALNEYVTESRSDRSKELINALARVRGAECGQNYAEAFNIVRSYE